MTPPRDAKKPTKAPAFGPHPEDAEELRLASEAAERREFLSKQESADMMEDLLGSKE